MDNGGACVKAGQAQWALLLRTFPERYAEWEREEQAFREVSGKPVSVLREVRNRITRPLTLQTLRERIEAQGTFEDVEAYDSREWGGCGCV